MYFLQKSLVLFDTLLFVLADTLMQVPNRKCPSCEVEITEAKQVFFI